MTAEATPVLGTVPLGTVRSMEDLHAVMRARAVELGVTRQSIGKAALLTPRYANRLLAPTAARHIGPIAMAGLMEALQFELVAVRRTDVPKRITDKLEKHRVTVSERGVRHVRIFSKRKLRANAKKGGRARARKLRPAARRKSAQKAALARWKDIPRKQRSEIARRNSIIRWEKYRAVHAQDTLPAAAPPVLAPSPRPMISAGIAAARDRAQQR